MTKPLCVVAYAGQSRERLLAQARAAFFFAAGDVPARFRAFLPIFPDSLVVDRDGVFSEGRLGFSLSAREYHRRLSQRLPELYADDNRLRNFDYAQRYLGHGDFTVDERWADACAAYRPFLGDKLMLYAIGGGHQAVAVPESVYPRSGGLLRAAEERMGVVANEAAFWRYAQERAAAGELYDAAAFRDDFLRESGLSPVVFNHDELREQCRALRALLDAEGQPPLPPPASAGARQYVPNLYACDAQTPVALGAELSRLAQLGYADSDYVSDFWIPYDDLLGFVDRARMTLDVAALCAYCQFAPRYDAEAGCGRFPDEVRVATVRDRSVCAFSASALNNPAHGGGVSPEGRIARLIVIPNSREHLQKRRLLAEHSGLRAENATLAPGLLAQALAGAARQERRGYWIDLMYQRDAAAALAQEGGERLAQTRQLLEGRIARLTAREEHRAAMATISGYDADLDALRRKRPSLKSDAPRERSVAEGYELRRDVLRVGATEFWP